MSLSKFLELFRGILILIGMDPAAAEASSYNALRRLLPSIAEVLELGHEELQSIGNWVEIPKGVTKPTDRASHPTSRIYAGDKDRPAIFNKHKAVIAACEVKKCGQAAGVALSPEGYWPAGSLTWDTLREARPSKGKAAKKAAAGEPWALREERWPLVGAEEWLRVVAKQPSR